MGNAAAFLIERFYCYRMGHLTEREMISFRFSMNC
jgi:hypothetical protein